MAYRFLSPAHLPLPYLMLPATCGTLLHARRVAIDYVTFMCDILLSLMGPAPPGWKVYAAEGE
jgi:hypothetical protein